MQRMMPSSYVIVGAACGLVVALTVWMRWGSYEITMGTAYVLADVIASTIVAFGPRQPRDNAAVIVAMQIGGIFGSLATPQLSARFHWRFAHFLDHPFSTFPVIGFCLGMTAAGLFAIWCPAWHVRQKLYRLIGETVGGIFGSSRT
jgi:hypothetical protein